MKNYVFFIIALCFLTSCAVQHKIAPIEYHHKNARLKSSYIHQEQEDIMDEDQPKHVNYNEIETLEESDIDKILDDFTDSDNQWQNRMDDPDYILPDAISHKEQKIIYHEVELDETIQDIAKQYQQSVEKIANTNHLTSPYELYDHQILKIIVPKNFQKTATNITTKDKDAIGPKKTSVFITPVQGKIISKFGDKTVNGINKGINIAANEGSEILSATNGKVIYADYDAIFGNLVIIKLNNKNVYASYAHIKNIQVAKGQIVEQGDLIGYVGKSGKVNIPQLHFAIRDGKIAKDPLKFVHY